LPFESENTTFPFVKPFFVSVSVKLVPDAGETVKETLFAFVAVNVPAYPASLTETVAV
jgi:hypothetical protein